MNQYQETELKLRLVEPSLYEQLISDPLLGSLCVPGRYKNAEYDTVYFDTADRRLLLNGMSLRRRNTGEGYVATVKESGTETEGLYVRGEWNKVLDDDRLTVQTFSEMPIGARLAKAVGGAELVPVVRTVFRRISMDLITDGACIEFAADRGEVTAGGRSQPFCEVELELKSGEVASLLQLGAALKERWPLEAEGTTKYRRGLNLAGIDFT